MEDRRYEQIAAASGFLLLGLSLIGFVIAPPPPGAIDPVDKVASYFADNRGQILLQSYVWMLSAGAFLWFIGSLRSYLRSAEGGNGRLSAVAFGGGVAGITVSVATTMFWIALALGSDEAVAPAVVQVSFDLGNVAFLIIGVPFAVMFAATGVVALRKHAFPVWLGWLSLALAVMYLVLPAGILDESGPLGPGGALMLASGLVYFVWIAAITVVMVRRSGVLAT